MRSRRVLHGVGRHVFGAAALLLGIACLVLHDQLISNWAWPGAAAFLWTTSLVQAGGGFGMQFRATARAAALTLGAVYLVIALTFVPVIFVQPGVYASWGDVFYALALVAGAMAACGLGRPAVILLGLCAASFGIEQVEFFARTVSLVPSWVPPDGTFWAIATTAAFTLAAISLVSGYKALLAARMLTLMMLIFAVATWIPILIADPRTLSNWSEGLETFAIAGAAWLVADFLAITR